MNPDKQRIAIAEYCGYKDIAFRIVAAGTGMDYEVLSSGVLGKGGVAIPDYLNDLNAMHDAEKTIPKRDKCIYANHLMMVVGFDGETDMVDYYGEWSTSKTTSLFSILNATAAQRAEAFLKTIGKWEE